MVTQPGQALAAHRGRCQYHQGVLMKGRRSSKFISLGVPVLGGFWNFPIDFTAGPVCI